MSPAEQLATLLLQARHNGASFITAWHQSLQRLDWPADPDLRNEWGHALQFARHEFRDAYQHPRIPSTLVGLITTPTETQLEQQIIRMALSRV